MTSLLDANQKETFATSALVESFKKAKEITTKGDSVVRENLLTMYKLNTKVLKQQLKKVMKHCNYIRVVDVVATITDDKFIKYVQISYTEEESDEDSKTKPFIRFYRNKVFQTEKQKNKKADFPALINVSAEIEQPSEEFATFRDEIFKVLYKLIFNSNPSFAESLPVKKDKYKTRIEFL